MSFFVPIQFIIRRTSQLLFRIINISLGNSSCCTLGTHPIFAPIQNKQDFLTTTMYDIIADRIVNDFVFLRNKGMIMHVLFNDA